MTAILRLPCTEDGSWDWQQQAACRGSGTSLFFHPENERGTARENREAKAKQVCMGCPVQSECAAHALAAHEPYGVWGGLTETERTDMLNNPAGNAEPHPQEIHKNLLELVPFAIVRHYELDNQMWDLVVPLLAPSHMGRPVRDRRQVVNGILWKLSTRSAWRDMPSRYGPWKTVYERFRRWSADGTWDRLLARVQAHPDLATELDWSVECVASPPTASARVAATTAQQSSRNTSREYVLTRAS